MAAQITQIYNLMEKVLAMSQATLEHVVSEVMYTTDLQALVAAAHVRKARYARWAPPANTGVQVSALFLPDAMLEIQATAVLGD
jgi:enamine deaminase RidA (YjgF/YER057c/UK114 family)